MRTLVILATGALAGCAAFQAPPAVNAAIVQSITLQTAVQSDVDKVIDAYTTALQARNTEKYALWLAQAEKLMTDSGGKVDLDKYKTVLGSVSNEVATGNAFYDQKATEFKTSIRAKLQASLALGMGVQKWEQAGVSQAAIDSLMNQATAIGTDLATTLANRPAKPPKPSQLDQLGQFLNQVNAMGGSHAGILKPTVP